MGKKPRSQHRKNLRSLNKAELRQYHHNHTKNRIHQRFGLSLDDNDIEEIIVLIRRKNPGRIFFAREGKKRNGDLIYIVLYRGKALAVVYSSKNCWIITCLRFSWALEGLSDKQKEEIKNWVREHRAESI